MVEVRGRVLSLSHRSRWDIMAGILSVAVKGETKTHIMYKCNLSFSQIQTYFDFLVDRGLLKAELRESSSSRRKILVTTDRGRAFLEAYRALKATVSKEKR